MRPGALLLLLPLLSAFSPAASGAEEIFTDATAASGLDFVHFNGMSGEYYMAEVNGAGCALFDYDNDGDLDLYLVQGDLLGAGKTIADARFPPRHPLPLRDRVYRNDLTVEGGARELRFTDVTDQSGTPAGGYGFGVAAGDYDNDGWVDLYVTNLGSNHLLRNAGAARGDGDGDGPLFRDVSVENGADDRRFSVPAAFFDYDRDGWLDLYVGNYVDFSEQNHKVCRTAGGARDYCGPSAFNGVPDRLFRNRGAARRAGEPAFEDVSLASGLGGVESKSLGAVAADLNGDDLPDLYVANDLMPNQMWIQQPAGSDGPLFRDEALLAGTAVNAQGRPEASMGVDAADFDGDGDDDLFMTHLVAETNTLYRNAGGGMFEDYTVKSGVAAPSWEHTSWGTLLFDYDNDGWLDLFIANGAVRTIEELAKRGDPFPFHETNQLLRNTGDGRFVEVTAEAGAVFALSEVSRGAAFGDVDNDGDTDVLLANNNGPARLLRNEVGSRNPWLGLRLVDAVGVRDQLGARVAVYRAGRPPLWRRARTDGSFGSANDPRVLVGLGGGGEKVEKVRVYWPSGRIEEWVDLPLRAYTTLREGSGKPVAGGDGSAG